MRAVLCGESNWQAPEFSKVPGRLLCSTKIARQPWRRRDAAATIPANTNVRLAITDVGTTYPERICRSSSIRNFKTAESTRARFERCRQGDRPSTFSIGVWLGPNGPRGRRG
jgi:hypothetical protein